MVAYDPDAAIRVGVPAPAPLPPVTFDDVTAVLGDPTYSEFAAAIAWMGRAGITAGTLTDAGRSFAPDLEVTRGDFAGFLYRLAGSPADVLPEASPFADAGPGDTPHAAEIAWLAAQGVVTGYRTGTEREFRPDEPLTRGTLARILHRFAGAPDATDSALAYADVTPGTRLAGAVAWLSDTVGSFGWDGPAGPEFRPGGTLTRGAAAAILHAAHRTGVAFTPWEAPLRLVDPTVVIVDVSTVLNLREGPSLDAAVATQLGDGATLATTGAVTRSGWVEVLHDDRRLWASPAYLSVTPGSTQGLVTAAGPAPVLAGTYENGAIPASSLCAVPWASHALLECGAAADLARLDQAFRAAYGIGVPVAGGYRDLAGQHAAAARYGGLAAVPGTSVHGWGAAIDLAEDGLPGGFTGEAYQWLVAMAPAYGWALPAWARPDGAKPEPWHFEHLG